MSRASFSLDKVIARLDDWKRLLPSVRPFYAVKTFPYHPLVAYLVGQGGCGVDCATKREIEQVVDIVQDPAADVIFANPCKPLADVDYARRAGVTKVIVDDVAELEKCRDMEIWMRISVDDSFSPFHFASKFGADRDTADAICRTAGVTIRGISFHVGSRCKSFAAYESAINEVVDLIDRNPTLRETVDTIDVGGGFEGSTFRTIAPQLHDALQDKLPQFQHVAEPGRYFAEASLEVQCTVISKRVRQGRCCYTLSDGIYGMFNNFLTDQIEFSGDMIAEMADWRATRNSWATCTLFGPTCDSQDVISQEIVLPDDLVEGEKITVPNMGAYTYALITRFNGVKSPRIYHAS